jgi:hypothetical protein
MTMLHAQEVFHSSLDVEAVNPRVKLFCKVFLKFLPFTCFYTETVSDVTTESNNYRAFVRIFTHRWFCPLMHIIFIRRWDGGCERGSTYVSKTFTLKTRDFGIASEQPMPVI